MKIHAYKVVPDRDDSQPLEQRLAEREGQSLAERLYSQSGLKLRLENHQRRNGLVELNFVSFRLSTAPVRLAEDRPLAEIEIEEDESFGEETACLYDPARRRHPRLSDLPGGGKGAQLYVCREAFASQ